MSRRRHRVLAPEERALWAHVVRAVKPLRVPSAAEPEPHPDVAPPPPEAVPPAAAKGPVKKVARQIKGMPASVQAPPAPPLAPLEPKARRRLTRGAEVDARLDLHGLTQAAAHHRLRLFLIEAQSLGHSVVLVITGKGDMERLSGHFGEGRGVLRRAVPHWLAAPELRGIVVGFEEAGRRHGGEGALYVRIRRRRGGS